MLLMGRKMSEKVSLSLEGLFCSLGIVYEIMRDGCNTREEVHLNSYLLQLCNDEGFLMTCWRRRSAIATWSLELFDRDHCKLGHQA